MNKDFNIPKPPQKIDPIPKGTLLSWGLCKFIDVLIEDIVNEDLAKMNQEGFSWKNQES